MVNYLFIINRLQGAKLSYLTLLAAIFSFVAPALQSQNTSYAYVEEVDPLEGINRDIHSFNELADTYILKPLAMSYREVTHDAIEDSISRIFDNLQEVGSAVNNLAQGKGYASTKNTGRFVVNSTVGLLGVFDVAEKIGIEKEDPEDFGQTLATWGVGSGPYIVLPFLGPSTLRDAPSRFVDRYFQPQAYLDDIGARNGVQILDITSTRARLLDFEESIPEEDPYSFIRDIYLQQREYQIRDGQVVDDFGADGSDDFLD